MFHSFLLCTLVHYVMYVQPLLCSLSKTMSSTKLSWPQNMHPQGLQPQLSHMHLRLPLASFLEKVLICIQHSNAYLVGDFYSQNMFHYFLLCMLVHYVMYVQLLLCSLSKTMSSTKLSWPQNMHPQGLQPQLGLWLKTENTQTLILVHAASQHNALSLLRDSNLLYKQIIVCTIPHFSQMSHCINHLKLDLFRYNK